MIINFLVLIFCSCEVVSHNISYCELCANHTLCKYKNSGPGDNCLGYDKNTYLTERDIRDILKRINYRRNYVALQNMKHLPGAANMRKMEWSSELALIAQRWADQCDSNRFPDKLDECRDTGDYRVGQNIATISGLGNGVNVKTFIDIWFIVSLEYSGTVLYYDQSRDNKTNYFTQLIWAESDKVGCGRVRFYIDRINSGFIERLVCNFGSKGNVHGKPVYIVGFPATQCPENMVPDTEFNGLCTYNTEINEQQYAFNNQGFYVRKSKLQNLRKLKPVNGITRTKYKNSNYNNAEHEKEAFVAVKRSNAELYDERLNTKEPKKFDHHPDEKGHSRLHNNHNHRMDFDPIHPNANQNRRNYEALVTLIPPSLNHNLDKICTRKYNIESNLEATTKRKHYDEKSNQCTRGQKKICSSTLSTLFNLCPCYTQKKQCTYSTSENTLCDSNVVLKHLNMDKIKNIVARRSNFSMGSYQNNVPEMYTKNQDLDDFLSLSQKVSIPAEQLTEVNTVLSTPSYIDRIRRETEPYTSEPFWKMSHPNKQLKDLKYTTISNRRNKKYQKAPKMTQTKSSRTTEFITISKDPPVNKKPLTEKYLSFDELLHLRKFNTANFRRAEENKVSSTPPTETFYDDNITPANLPNYTLTTGFTHVKFCTRKLTCTWTAAFLTDADGNPKGLNNAMGIGNAYGSRTPVGYVEGCTRTSTCTRDFMYKNKGAELSTVATIDPNAHADDEDYCERRSLNKRSNISKKVNNRSKFKIMNKNNSTKKVFNARVENNRNKTINTKVRTYRNVKEKKESDVSYGELYYLVVKRLLESWKLNKAQSYHKKCMCSNSKTIETGHDICLFILVSALYYRLNYY